MQFENNTNNGVSGIPFPATDIMWHTIYYISIMNILYKIGDRKFKTSSDTMETDTVQQNPLKTLFLSSFNFVCLGGGVWLHSYFYGHTDTESWSLALAKLVGCRIMADVWFYTTHRLFHSRWLYKFHKVHHEWKYPLSYATFYAHPLENIVANLCTILSGLHIFQTSHALSHFWILTVLTQSVFSHSGDIKLGPIFIKSRHDYHHMYLNCAYGNDLFMDRLFKTTVRDFEKSKVDKK
jgi:sterol desaturase/sphingolipid hydroxylase (fatty acid hydroxylase superfamily)